jgi:hypothetical protein
MMPVQARCMALKASLADTPDANKCKIYLTQIMERREIMSQSSKFS